MDKKSLRQQIRILKKQHSQEELQILSEQILQRLAVHPRFLQAEKVMLYASLPDEVQTLDFIETWRHRKTIILPTVVGDDIIPVELADNVTFAEGDFHIPEPQNHPYTGDFDLIVVPGMAFDSKGHRLGRGRGYYDRFLAQHPNVYTIGLCFDFQLLPEVPFEPHDRIMDEVITFISPKVNTFEEHFENIFKDQEPKTLYEPIIYTLASPGKRLRPRLIHLAADMFDGDDEEANRVASAYEMLHNFTLIHDDIMDKAEIRRGRPTVHKKWNTNTAILSGDALVVTALLQLYQLTCKPEIVLSVAKLFAQVSMETCKGQQYDLDFETAKTVTIDQYLMMIQMKTATMFAGCLKSGGLIANADAESLQALYDLGIHLGIAFQLADDLLDVYADTEVFGKAIGSDIKDNKKTFIYLKALELSDKTQSHRLQTLFSSSDMDEKTKFQEVKAIFDAVNVKQATEEKISYFIDKCFEDIERIHVDESKKTPVKILIQHLKNRSK